MRISFRGKTLQDVLAKIEAFMAEGSSEVGAEDLMEQAIAKEAAKATKVKSPSKAAIAKAKDLAEKSIAAGEAAPPEPPAPVGASGAKGTPVPPDGRMTRPLCKDHGAALDATKFRHMLVTPDRCVQCVMDKDAGAKKPADAEITADEVKKALEDVNAAFDDEKCFEVLDAVGGGAHSVNNPKVPKANHLKPELYQAVMDMCAELLIPREPELPISKAKARAL